MRRALLAEFEAAERLSNADRQAADLPLFTGGEPAARAAPRRTGPALDAIDPDELSPRAAQRRFTG